MAKICKAADKTYPPAMYQVAARAIDDAANAAASWEKMRQAAVLGSREAQFFLGDRYERGDGVAQSADRAKNYFRLSAPTHQPPYQYPLPRLLFSPPAPPL